MTPPSFPSLSIPLRFIVFLALYWRPIAKYINPTKLKRIFLKRRGGRVVIDLLPFNWLLLPSYHSWLPSRSPAARHVRVLLRLDDTRLVQPDNNLSKPSKFLAASPLSQIEEVLFKKIWLRRRGKNPRSTLLVWLALPHALRYHVYSISLPVSERAFTQRMPKPVMLWSNASVI